jgi:hypothetical protein
MESRLKTGFLGFYITLESLILIAQDLFASENPPKYILTFKFSQDNLETFFSAIRSRCGFNNNPSVRTFIAAMKSLMVHAEIKISSGNCSLIAHVPILRINRLNETRLNDKGMNGNDDVQKDGIDDEDVREFFVDNISKKLGSSSASLFKENITGYIVGFIVSRLNRVIKCEECLNACLAEFNGAHNTAMNLFFFKQRVDF